MKDIKPGSNFGFLTVIEFYGRNDAGKRLWKCQCTCGKFRLVTSGHLGTKNVMHCGCRASLPRKDLTGKLFHDWTVLKYVGSSRYLCRCRCGTEKKICNRELQNGDSKSCGCREKPNLVKDLTGLVFDRLTVLTQIGINKHRNALWKCQCSCGKTVVITSGSLHKGCKSCGCAQRDSLFNRTAEERYTAYIKGTRTANLLSVRYHWKTGKELVCRGSWEPLVVDYLNVNQIEFDWQIPHLLQNGKTYIVDLYLITQDLWVEIKGFARISFLQKWELFQVLYPNSVIWTKDNLKALGITFSKRKG